MIIFLIEGKRYEGSSIVKDDFSPFKIVWDKILLTNIVIMMEKVIIRVRIKALRKLLL